MFLVGNYQHSLDDKNRIRLPSKHRDAMGTKYILMPGMNGCSFVYPADDESRLLKAFQDLESFDPDQAEWLRSITEFSDVVEPDGQGRFMLSADLREICNIKKDVRIVGSINKVEIWSEEAYLARRSAQDHSPKAFDELYRKLHKAMETK
ncbi:MAG: hypothetical protein IJZ28_00730 [Clostridia bacterium]|nr:hypothetical protein [Clostridia bacterium]